MAADLLPHRKVSKPSLTNHVTVFGPDFTTAPTPRCMKGFFDDGAQAADRILSDIRRDHKQHVARLDCHVLALANLAQYDRGSLRADMEYLWQEVTKALAPTAQDLTAMARDLTDY